MLWEALEAIWVAFVLVWELVARFIMGLLVLIWWSGLDGEGACPVMAPFMEGADQGWTGSGWAFGSL